MATWALSGLAANPSSLGGGGGEISVDQVAELRDEIELEARSAVEGLPADRLPLRLPKSKVTDLLACEAYAVGGRGDRSERLSAAQARGIAADHVVAAWCGGARFDGTVDSAGVLVEAYCDPSLLHWWHTADPSEHEELAAALAGVAEGLASVMGPIDPAWAVRTQVAVAATFADGAVICEGRFDLELGGAPSAVPAAIVDVKTGSHADAARAEHGDDLLIYALLATLRDSSAPAWVGTWHATQASLDARPVGFGALSTAADRFSRAIEKLAELKAVRVPEETVGPQCQWCELRDSCDTALAVASSCGDVAAP